VNTFIISGGEPLMQVESARSIMLQAFRHGVRDIILVTNGTLLVRRSLDQLACCGLRTLVISIDGFREQHDVLRGPGAFGMAASGLKAAIADRDEGRLPVSIVVQSVLTKVNCRRMSAFARWVYGTGADGFTMQPLLCKPGIFGLRSASEVSALYNALALTEADCAEVEDLLTDLDQLRRRANDFVQVTPNYASQLRHYVRGRMPRESQCPASQDTVCLDPGGDVRLCSSGRPIGTVGELPLRAILLSERAGTERRRIRSCRTPCVLLTYARAP
jgi:MoaA/NifB/PqqE/SkfB family radical SAM enzyme